MSVRSAIRAFPTLMRVGFGEALAYRAEMLVWVLATTMPLIMMALWVAVARDAPVAGFGQTEFVAYFLSTFLVRQLTGSWAAWQLNFEVRQGTLAMRLLRPVHPVFCYAVEHLAAIPMRLIVAVPVAVIMLATVGGQYLPGHLVDWLMWGFALVGAWLMTFLANVAMGALSFFMQSSLKVVDMWWTLFFVFSGYLFPIGLLPGWAQSVVNVLPFRYQLGLPVELLNSMHPRAEGLTLLAVQWVWVGVLWLLFTVAWRSGLKRFAAFGG